MSYDFPAADGSFEETYVVPETLDMSRLSASVVRGSRELRITVPQSSLPSGSEDAVATEKPSCSAEKELITSIGLNKALRRAQWDASVSAKPLSTKGLSCSETFDNGGVTLKVKMTSQISTERVTVADVKHSLISDDSRTLRVERNGLVGEFRLHMKVDPFSMAQPRMSRTDPHQTIEFRFSFVKEGAVRRAGERKAGEWVDPALFYVYVGSKDPLRKKKMQTMPEKVVAEFPLTLISKTLDVDRCETLYRTRPLLMKPS